MIAFLRDQNPKVMEDMATVIAGTVFPPGADAEAARAAFHTALADRWRYRLRADAEYLAWRREREPGYMPPDEPDPNAWEHLTAEQRRDRVRLQRRLGHGREQIQGLSPARRRAMLHVDRTLGGDPGDALARLRKLSSGNDAELRALAMATLDRLAVLEGR